MLKVIKKFFRERILIDVAGTEIDSDHALNLATAALLIEMMRSDFETSDVERDTILSLMHERLKLAKDEVEEIFAMAEQEVQEAVSLYQFTALIDQGLDYDKKVQVIEMAWHVVYADQVLDKYEEATIRKMADLLHISHRDFIQTKHQVMPG